MDPHIAGDRRDDRGDRGDRGDRDKRHREYEGDRDKRHREYDGDRDKRHREYDGGGDRGEGGRKKRSPSPDLATREMEEAMRDDLTVLVQRIHPHADDFEIFEFFSQAGKVRDIRLIRDQRSNKSKGVGYVEYSEPQSVLNALALNGIAFKGQPLLVQARSHTLARPSCCYAHLSDLAAPRLAHLTLDTGHWTLDTGHLDTGHWTLDTGLWPRDLCRVLAARACLSRRACPGALVAQASMAEKNRLAQQAKNVAAASALMGGSTPSEPTKLIVSELDPNIQQQDVKDVFEPFGEVGSGSAKRTCVYTCAPASPPPPASPPLPPPSAAGQARRDHPPLSAVPCERTAAM